ncbi:NYN domain-containing protein [Campylobacter hyointestinalis]|uniref:NYN domain-containing protein n=1 Tax=Campylobacter hyointestinalis subsp. hyointestinalis TaxID=91352 RepID=A0A855N9Z6_CAMHY|nr:NYN domain-containing protein [Campylobacter hyointestinalis]PPB58463.1 NYN domain-containing protein [Campylobacter hyointestinalis subsp. hyointestinalis]PPB62918.1 NYN domain-containing protein [Campylobacter hyointestinalis subsp. hyointestinalis]PPB71316.1 NYN domain-containing protein [Campylobacter hyointestinalis subsp. hyointestinalis]
MRVYAYIDGFNLYHSILSFNEPRLKWLNLRSLCESFLQKGDELNEVYFFSAYLTHIQDKFSRHFNYVKALQSVGVTPVMGKFKKKYPKCKICFNKYQTYEEKQSDINIAITLLRDAFLDKFDKAFLITADTDLVSTIKMIKELFPKKPVILLIPPKRRKYANELIQTANANFEIKKANLLKSLLSDTIYLKDEVIKIPNEYLKPL